MSQHDPDHPEHQDAPDGTQRPVDPVAADDPDAATREQASVQQPVDDWTQVTRPQPVVPPQAPGPWGYPAPGQPPAAPRHAAPSARVAGWVWPVVAMLALVVGVVGGVVSDTPVNLLGQHVRNRLDVLPDQSGERAHPLSRSLGIRTQRTLQICVLIEHPVPQSTTIDLNLQELEYVQGSGVTHNVFGEIGTERVRADLRM
nr:hypothetical protein [uncultured Nocardioides sp.]